MHRLFLPVLLFLAAPAVLAQSLVTDPDSARVVTEDIARFWAAWDRLDASATREDSVRVFQEAYLDPGSAGLGAFTELRIHSAEELVAQVSSHRRYYEAIRPNTLRAPEMAGAIREGMRSLQAHYPDAVFPDVYLLIGRMNSGGTLTEAGLYIGTELYSRGETTPVDELNDWERSVVKSSDGLPCIVLHELMHYQQDTAASTTLLARSIREGSADFLTHVVAGCSINDHLAAYGDANEAALWTQFREEMHGDDFSNWLYQGAVAGERPADLGYYMGYRIAEAYYERAEDKAQAFHDILHIQDFEAFLDASGYAARFEG
jgi:hypothetical protein